MRLNRFYSSIPLGEEVVIVNKDETSELFNQISHVFRAKIGYTCVFFDGKNNVDHIYELINIDKKSLSFIKKQEVLKENNLRNGDRVLCLALIKKDSFEEVVQKAVEIGINKIIPVLSERSEKKLLNKERLEKIVIEAVEQCGRNDIPTLDDIQKIEDIIKIPAKHIVFDTNPSQKTQEDNRGGDIFAWVGPEGGWTDSELGVFRKHDTTFCHLDTYTLRATTAGVLASFYIVNS